MSESKWKRMASAPRDGTPFLAVCETEDRDEYEWAVCYLSDGGRTLCFDAGMQIVEDYAPTHWMPLPDPPTVKSL